MKQLNDWYEKHFGYRPSDETPDITLEEMAALCALISEIVSDEAPLAFNDNHVGAKR